MGSPADRLQDALGHRFASPRWLEEALTHPSIRLPGTPGYERLEFLGDAVLGLAVSEELFRLEPDLSEGEMTRRRSRLVNRDTLARLAEGLPLAEALRASKGLSPNLPASALANALEALIAAVYLDGGLEAARAAILKLYRGELGGAGAHAGGHDPKSELQELSQKRFGAAPSYQVTQASGPAHRRAFTVTAFIEGRPYGSGKGASKKEAEREAARNALSALANEAPTF